VREAHDLDIRELLDRLDVARRARPGLLER
jgi:hypothetical protein